MTITILDDQDGNPKSGNTKDYTGNVQFGGRRSVRLANAASKEQGKDKKGKALVGEEIMCPLRKSLSLTIMMIVKSLSMVRLVSQ